MAVVTVVSLERRLATLEAAHGEHYGPSPFADGIYLLVVLVAVHLGDLTEREAPADGLARARGYPSTPGMREAMRRAGDPITGWSVRHAEVVERLLAQRRIDRAMGPVVVREGLRNALDEISEPIRALRLGDRNIKRALTEAVEWICL